MTPYVSTVFNLDESGVRRECYTTENLNSPGCADGWLGDNTASVCVCITDRCNSASHLSLTGTSLIGVLLGLGSYFA